MRFVVGALLGFAACYSPDPPANLPCGDGEACPIGQSCRLGICRVDGEGGPLDADPSGDGSTGDAPMTDAAPDAPRCFPGNDVCLVECVGMDPDCTTTCGDNRCVGNAGELCGTTCPADCASTANICGNAMCQAGESPDCFADCGPTPWTWMAEEQQLLTLVNNARTNGTACPGMGSVVRPALVVDPTLSNAAREWAWEIAHHDYYQAGAGCSGRTIAQRKIDGNFGGWQLGYGHATVQAAFNSWMASASSCPIVMTANSTRMSVSVAFATQKAYVMVID